MGMRVVPLPIPGLLLIEPEVLGDARGFFVETYNRVRYAEAGIGTEFVQDNLSRSRRGVLRGLHFQHPHDQAKLVTVFDGEVFDVAVDIRVGSPTFGKHVAVTLSGESKRQLYIPKGFAHGFCVVSETALFTYKVDDVWSRDSEGGILFDDPALGIGWPAQAPLLSDKDKRCPRLADVDPRRLPKYTT
jgi:dTDP-4-dehydrorhamnose 3,5-epimerase